MIYSRRLVCKSVPKTALHSQRVLCRGLHLREPPPLKADVTLRRGPKCLVELENETRRLAESFIRGRKRPINTAESGSRNYRLREPCSYRKSRNGRIVKSKMEPITFCSYFGRPEKNSHAAIANRVTFCTWLSWTHCIEFRRHTRPLQRNLP